MNEKFFLKASLFFILMLFAPSFYMIFVAAGFIPAIFYLFFIIAAEEGSIVVLWLVHLLVYGVLNIIIANLTMAIIYRIKGIMIRNLIILMTFLMIIIVSLLPIYVIGGHNSSTSVNILGVYQLASRISYLPW